MRGILFQGALIVSMDEERPEPIRGDILVKGGLIHTIATHPDRIEPEHTARVVDCSSMLLMPGLVNTHGHAAMTLFRGVADDMPLADWLEKIIFPLEDLLDGDDIYWGTMLSIAEMLKSGTTTFTDMYVFMDRVAEAAAESGIRAVLARGLGGDEQRVARQLSESEALAQDWHGAAGGRISISIGPHAPYTCSPALLQQAAGNAARAGVPLQIHLAETAGEVERSLQEHGRTPVSLVNELGLFEQKVIAAHCVHLDDNDIAILAENNVGVSHNPGSNLKLGSGIAPLAALLGAGVAVGLGTDGAASNNNLDMWEEIRLASTLSKGVHRDPTLVPAGTALQMATVQGAAVLGLAHTGAIKEGWKADMVGISLDEPRMAPLHDARAHLVYSAGAGDVRLVAVDGKILVEGGQLTNLDEEKIVAEAARRAYRLTERSKLPPGR